MEVAKYRLVGYMLKDVYLTACRLDSLILNSFIMNKIFKAFVGLSFALVVMLTLTSQAYAATDFGTDLDGNQCASELKEDGTCNLIYNINITLEGTAGSFNIYSKLKIAQAKAITLIESLAHQAETRRQICLIISCPDIK